MWSRLWALPIAVWWHEQRIEPTIVATYVRLATTKPEHASCLKLMTELGLTPASLQRLRLIVEAAEPEAVDAPDPYQHLRADRRMSGSGALNLRDVAQHGVMESQDVRRRILRIGVYPSLNGHEESTLLLGVNAALLVFDRCLDLERSRMRNAAHDASS